VNVGSVTSVFDRYFIVGFFLPSFFWLSYFKLLAGPGVLAPQVEKNDAAAFAIVGVVALVLGLLLQGIRIPVIRIYSGWYAMALWRDSRHKSLQAAGAALKSILRWKMLREYRRLASLSAKDTSDVPGPRRPDESVEAFAKRRQYEYELEFNFPDGESRVLPTKFGNRIRAWEDYARTRWSLETVVIRPYVEAMLSDQETDLRTSAETDLSFALNMSVLALVLGMTLGIDRAAEPPPSLLFIAACTAPLLLALAFYEIAGVAAVAWGNTVRATVDLHRLDLYERLGVRQPTTAAETAELGKAINRMLLYGEVLPDALLKN